MGSVTPPVGREFDSFLYATVGEDANGMPLTVLSALARMDVDPWDEAAKLTQLPPEGAARKLSSLLGALKVASVADFDPAHIAVPLVALLPRPPEGAQSAASFATNTRGESSRVPLTVLYLASYVIFILLSNWLMGNLHASGQARPAVSSAAPIDEPATSAAGNAKSMIGGPP